MRRAALALVLIAGVLGACAPETVPTPVARPTGSATRATGTVSFTSTATPGAARSPTAGTTAPAATRTATRVPTPTSTSRPHTKTPLPPLQLPEGVAALLYVRRGDVSLWDGARDHSMTSGAPVALAPPPRIAPDGRRVLLVRTAATGAGVPYPRQTVTVMDLRTRSRADLNLAPLPAPQGGWPVVVWADWLPDGAGVLLRTMEADARTGASALAMADEYWRADPVTGEIALLADLDGTPGAGSSPAGAPVLSPDGRYAALPAADAVYLLDIARAHAAALLPFGAGTAPDALPALGWAPSSETLYAATSVGQGAGIAFWQIDVSTGGVVELGRLPASVVDLAGHPPRWSPDGRWTAWANAQGLVYLAPAEQPDRLQPWGTSQATELLAWSPDGSALAASHKDGSLLILSSADASARPLADVVPAGGVTAWQAAWSGAYLIATGRQLGGSLVVIFGPGGASLASGPLADWGFAPVTVPVP